MAFAFLRKDLFSQSPTIGHLQAKSAVLMTTSNVDHLLVSVMKTYSNGDLKDKREGEGGSTEEFTFCFNSRSIFAKRPEPRSNLSAIKAINDSPNLLVETRCKTELYSWQFFSPIILTFSLEGTKKYYILSPKSCLL